MRKLPISVLTAVALLFGSVVVAMPDAASAATASGNPVKIGVIAELSGSGVTFPEIPPSAIAAASSINKRGGINGRPVKIIVCDDQGNPNVAAQCGHEMATDGTVAVTGNSDVGSSFVPILASADVPWLTATPNSSTEQTSPNSFPLGAGDVATFSAAGALCAKLGSKKIGVGVYDTAGATDLVPFLYKAIAPFGLTKADTVTVPIPLTAVDLSSYAASLAAQGATCVVPLLPASQEIAMAQAIDQSNPSVKVVFFGGVVAHSQVQTLGNVSNIYDSFDVPAPTSVRSAGIPQYNKDMQTYAPHALRDTNSISVWGAVRLVAQELQGAKKMTGAALISRLNTAGTITLPPFPPMNFAKPTNYVKGLRIFSNDIIFVHYVKSVPVAYYGGKFVDFTKLASLPALKG